ncbi:putative apicomplexan small protein [Gregarina niphandrodes]|uniref:Apicomplexan small protein n=1 Tax=Gregarina niphandrodes TaxID=110365 RepID=A0A023B7Q6_GRENI|nr:putative apicomplexan small protein [Gregarina niphandrodes]EZG67603.1 putative apicomplexan small protein [Gregarina niphandrodes]|eukprot:XP_011130193.1 putative apicomplexan small protein [Gregarina niphandrodes]
MALFLMCISAACLHLFSHLWNVAQRPEFVQWKIGKLLKTLFHINKTFDFNLTHVMLMSVIICLLSLRPDFELKESQEARKNKKKAATSTDSQM